LSVPRAVAAALKREKPPDVDAASDLLWDGGCDGTEGSLRARLTEDLCGCIDGDFIALADALLTFWEDHWSPDVLSRRGGEANPAFRELNCEAIQYFRARRGERVLVAADVKLLIDMLRRSWRAGVAATASTRALLDGFDLGLGPTGVLGAVRFRHHLTPEASRRAVAGDLIPRGTPLPWLPDQDGDESSEETGRTRYLARVQEHDVAVELRWRPHLPDLDEPGQIGVLLRDSPSAAAVPRHLEDLKVTVARPPPSSFEGLLDEMKGDAVRIAIVPARALPPEAMADLSKSAAGRGLVLATAHEANAGFATFLALTSGELIRSGKLQPCPACGARPGEDLIVVTHGRRYAIAALACNDLDHDRMAELVARAGISLVAVPACTVDPHRLLARATLLRRDGVLVVVATG
jgi:hypothetical protein